jgi:hypothetical protein
MVSGRTVTFMHLVFCPRGDIVPPASSHIWIALPLHAATEQFEHDYLVRSLVERRGNISWTIEALCGSGAISVAKCRFPALLNLDERRRERKPEGS